jgi:hypothetical protein
MKTLGALAMLLLLDLDRASSLSTSCDGCRGGPSMAQEEVQKEKGRFG